MGGGQNMVIHFRELRVYQTAFRASMQIFELSKKWPLEERYSLTDQVRRSSRAICANIAEAWGKRRYPSHFISKLTDADAEALETQNWLAFAFSGNYLQQNQQSELNRQFEEISRDLIGMMNHPESWCGPSTLVQESASEYLIEAE